MTTRRRTLEPKSTPQGETHLKIRVSSENSFSTLQPVATGAAKVHKVDGREKAP